MKPEYDSKRAKDFIDALAMRGRLSFSSREALDALGSSPDAVKLALNRLRRQGLIASPARGFYVSVPLEYRSLQCLPADQFIPTLMAQQGHAYYAGLLTAAQYYGAAHHRPQAFQVFLEKNRRPIHCGKVRVTFIARKRLNAVPVKMFNTPRGQIKVSTPEATAIDLAGYPQHAGGLDMVATVLTELASEIDADRLLNAATTAPLAWVQRLGYLLERSDTDSVTHGLKAYVAENARDYVSLQPGSPTDNAHRNKVWKVVVNADVEPEL